MLRPQLSNWCTINPIYWGHILRRRKKRHPRMPFLSSIASHVALRSHASLVLRLFAGLSRPAARQRRHAPVRSPRRPLTVRVAAEHPALQRRLLQLVGLPLVERLLAELLVRALPLERRVAERPVQRVIGDEAVERETDVMPIARPPILLGRRRQLPAHRTHLDDAARAQEGTLAFRHPLQ